MSRCYYPYLRWQGSGADGFDDGDEGAASCEARGIDAGADVRLALSRPRGAVTVGPLPLDCTPDAGAALNSCSSVRPGRDGV